MDGMRTGAIAAATLVTPAGPGPLGGPGAVPPLRISDGAVAWREGVVTYIGPADGLGDVVPERFDGCTIAPGFVDCHTHLPFVGWRADEFEARLAGATYRDLHGGGGGIRRSARLLAAATDDEVLDFCRPLLAEMLAHGTTALELKTGYGLSVEGELRQARLARRLADEAEQTCTVTLLPCHAVPEGTTRGDWVGLVCRELIPAAAAQGLVDAVDVYVEDIAFTLEDLRAVAEAASTAGLPLRCHADQLGPSGAAEAAAALGARSADHLNHVSDAGVRALGEGATAAVLLPTSTLFLRAEPPDVRALVDGGAVVAIATDFNPGTSPVLSMPQAIATACSLYGLTPQQALAASTANPARVLGLERTHGTLAPGTRADLVVLDGDDVRQVPYRPGHDPVIRTVVGGKVVWER
jgi:imidazolonepropionase